MEPKVFVLAESAVDQDALKSYLEDIGAVWSSDAPSDVEELVEIMSRSCYMSFGVGINPNITRVREGNPDHLAHILSSGHGSVMEHAWVSFMFRNVSRVFTHELVRHRVGVAISQESLRYVRLDDLGQWIPSCFSDSDAAIGVMARAFEECEIAYQELLNIGAMKEGTDDFNKLPFSKKKEYTSAARRVSPIGLATNIGWSCNIRSLRHVIEMRTDPGAEEEIRLIFGKVAAIAQERWPNLFGDYKCEIINGLPHYITNLHKV